MKTENKQKNLENTILDACLSVGKMIKENAYDLEQVEWKKLDDPVTDLDKKAERIIRDKLEKYNVNIMGEEYGIDDKGSDISIYIDPIDGTKSFLRKEFHSSVSIAADHKDNGLFYGVVYDFMRGILYYADKKGAKLMTVYDGKVRNLPIEYPRLKKISISLDNAPEIYEKLSDSKTDIRKIDIRKPVGSIALSLAQLAVGSYDGLIIMSKKKNGLTDTADLVAGYYLVKQTGAYITDINGKEFDYKRPYKGMIVLRSDVKKQILEKIR
jgi:myo-inositol-1(or 4)-monophosphatase